MISEPARTETLPQISAVERMIEGAGTPGDPICVSVGIPAPGDQFSDLGYVTSKKFGRLFAALAKAQAEFKPVEKDKVNTYFGSKYATLSSVMDAIRIPLASHGIALIQPPSMDGDQLTIITKLIHGESGEWIASVLSANVRSAKMSKKRGEDGYNDDSRKEDERRVSVQQIGSAVTYLKRYAICSILGIVADEDDDGNEASFGRDQRGNYQQQQAAKPNRSRKPDPEPPKQQPAKEEQPYMALARVLAKQYGGKSVEDYSLLTTAAYEDPAMTWDHIKASPELVAQVADTLQKYCERHSVEPGNLLAALKQSLADAPQM